MRAVHQAIPLLQVLVFPVGLNDVPDNRAFWVPKDQARSSGLSQTEQVKLLPYSPVVSAKEDPGPGSEGLEAILGC